MFAANFAVYGVREVWRQMMREGFPVARCTVARLMREMSLAGVIRGKPVRMTISDKAAPCPLDHVNRRFYALAPNMLWVEASIDQRTKHSFRSPTPPKAPPRQHGARLRTRHNDGCAQRPLRLRVNRISDARRRIIG